MKNEIKDLIDQKKKNDSKKNAVKGSNKAIKEKLIKEVNPILKIMSKVESDVLKEMKEKYPFYSFYGMRPIPRWINNIYSMSVGDELLKIKESNYDCDGWYSKSYKIPLSYFDMTEDQIEEAHTKWCTNHLEERVKKSHKSMIESKKEQIKRLESEIKKLKEYKL